jgi:hypothetical protein
MLLLDTSKAPCRHCGIPFPIITLGLWSEMTTTEVVINKNYLREKTLLEGNQSNDNK